MKKVKLGKFSFADASWNNCSDKAKDFISKLLTYDIEARPSAEEAIQHPWIVEMSKSSIDNSLVHGAFANLKTFRADQKLK
jgi:serine/threonine protein kinase